MQEASASRFPRPFGKYVLLRQLAVGGMAEVYLARQSGMAGFEKECVIKRILPSLALDAQFVQMFLDEARIAARLTHPNIVQIFDLGEVDGHDHYIAMEFVHGVDLQEVLEAERKRGGRVPLAVALRLVSNVAEGLDHAHRATDGRGHPLGIVHRDVTPSNVIVSFDGVAKICDFGIAKAKAKGGVTEVGVIKGKIPYMSPEQVQGEALDARSDQFSVGVLLYELTVGHKPFDGSNPAELSIKILHDEPQPPELAVPHFPEALSQILSRALSKRPADRYSSARELQVAVEEFLLTSGIRCTSHEVSAYLDDLFPGRREHVPETPASPVNMVTDPTVPMRVPTGAGPDGPGGPQSDGSPEPVMRGDLSTSTHRAYDDARRNLGGGGGGTIFIVLFLIAAVAFGFWYLRGHMTGETPASATPASTTPAPAVPEPAKPAAEPPRPAVVAEPAKPEPVVAPAPKPLEPPPVVEPAKPAPVAVKPAAHPAPAKHVKPPAHHAPPFKPVGDRPLPKLPGPPPADDNAE